MVISEGEVLKPREPSISDENDWEVFKLANVQIRDGSTGEPVNLLFVDENSPAVVTGRLELPEKRQQKFFLRQPYTKATNIEIQNVMRYSYGMVEGDGDIVFWIAGEAGWYQISPARGYKAVYDDMAEAIRLLYFCVDIYADSGSRGGPSASMIFQEYAEDERSACEDAKDAAEVFYKHKTFLIQSMLLRKEGISWSNKPLYQHMRNMFPDEFKKARDHIQRIYAEEQAKEQKKSKAEPRKSPSQDAAQSRASSQTKEKTGKNTNAKRQKRDENWWKAFVLWELVQKTRLQGLLGAGDITIDGIARVMVRRYHIDAPQQAAEYVKFHASNLQPMMDRPKARRIYDWSEEPIYKELASSNLSSAAIKRVSSLELRLRENPLPDTDTSESGTETSSSTEVTTPKRRGMPRGKSSVLRPRGKKYSSKAASRKGRANTIIVDEVDDTDTNPDIMELVSPTKRKGEAEAPNPRKRTTRSQTLISTSESEIDEVVEVGGPTGILPLRSKQSSVLSTTPSRPSFIPSIISSPLPSSISSNSVADTFVCTVDGCNHHVYDANKPESKLLIRQHYAEHNAQQQQQIQLVMSEEHRSNLPVSNLIKRIRDLATQQENILGPTMDLGLLADKEFPPAITRSY